jgi:hypothetical protein
LGPSRTIIALGADGSVYQNMIRTGSRLDDYADNRIFVGVARSVFSHHSKAWEEFCQGKEPRAYGFNGIVYVQCRTYESIMKAQDSGDPMFWGAALSLIDAGYFLADLQNAADEIVSRWCP